MSSRWWANESKDGTRKSKVPELQHQVPAAVESCQWTFKVFVNFELLSNEKVALIGSCEQLGSWRFGNGVIMDRSHAEQNVWTVSVNVPTRTEFQYRYFITGLDSQVLDQKHVRRWETHLGARIFSPISNENVVESESFDTFGDVAGKTKIDRGWLTTETVVQFVFYKNPFLFKDREKQNIRVKVTPINLLEDSLSREAAGKETSSLLPSYAFVEVCKLNENAKGAAATYFTSQPQLGSQYNDNDVIIIHVTIKDTENVAFLIDLYADHLGSSGDQTPTHLGFNYILPNALSSSDGHLDLPLTCPSKHRPMGMMRVEYLKIHPLPEQDVLLSMERSFVRHWNRKWAGLEVGHRGSGSSFKATEGNVVRENTIASFKKAASNGADFVEFDVQISQDLVPVIYHDFKVHVGLKNKKPVDLMETLELPLGTLTLDQLERLKVFHAEEAKKKEYKFHDEDLEEHQPFPTLQHALEMVDIHVGFNVEIKWSQRWDDGRWEATNTSDKNLFVDSILGVVLKHASQRRIVFSTFDPDLATMLRLKQNIFPVMFLTIGSNQTKYQPYYDPRCQSHRMAIEHAQAMELLGIVGHSEDLLKDPSQIKQTLDNGLVLFCWGEDNNNVENIRLLKSMGLHAIIYDKLDSISTKEKKENLFRLGARGSQ